MATVGMTGDTGASTVAAVRAVVDQVAHLAVVTLAGQAARIFPPWRVTLSPTSKAVELSRVMWTSEGFVHEHFVALRPEAAVKVNNIKHEKCAWVMPARSEFALKDATKPVPSGEKLTEDKAGGGNGWMCDSTVNVCPWGYTTWY